MNIELPKNSKKPRKAIKPKKSEDSELSDFSEEVDDLKDSDDSDLDVDDKKNAQTGRNRYTFRTSVNEIFEQISGIENSGDHESSSPAVFRFQSHKAKTINFGKGFEEGDLTYAPSRRNPYYMSIQRDKMGEIFNQQRMGKWATETTYPLRPTTGTAFQSYFNVSLKLFQDVANDSVDWLSLSRVIDPQVPARPDEDEKREAEMLKEMAFDGLLDNPENDPMQGQEEEEMANPPLLIDIDFQTQMLLEESPVQLENTTETREIGIDAMWTNERAEIVREILHEKGRRIYLPIRHQKGWLCWLCLGTWDKTLEGRLRQLKAIKKGFAKAWMTATATDPDSTAGYRARFSSANLGFPLIVVPDPEILSIRMNWRLVDVDSNFGSLVKDINGGVTQQNTYLEVKKQHEVNGAGYVKMGENPFGLFTTYITLDHYNLYMKSLEVVRGHTGDNLERRDAHRHIDISQNNIQSINKRLKDDYKPMKDFDTGGQANYTKSQTDAMLAMKDWEKLAKDTGVSKTLYLKVDGFGSTWRIDVSKEKMSDARGERIAKYAPAKIMGMSANNAAQYALGWKPLDKAFEYLGHEQRMSSGFFMAEWLHLCAFSWGGLTRLSDKGEELYRSSDIPGNLVLGTSETNSVMTRFEKAWQTLVIDSPDLSLNDSYPKLTVTRNMPNEPVVRDVKNAVTGNYSRKTSEMSGGEKNLAKAYDFLAYTISYSLRLPNGCKLLNMTISSSLHTTFYPFLRPLYHKLEDQLDKALYEKMKQRHHGQLMDHTQSHYPHSQNNQTVQTGADAYGGSFIGSQVAYQHVVHNGHNPHNSGDDFDSMGSNTVKKRAVFN